MAKLRRGDHIYISKLFYEHHGIYCGDGTVIHYSAEEGGGSKIRVRRRPLSDFGPRHRLRIRRYKECDDADTVMERAMAALGENSYDLLFNNCEHFACYCKVGLRRSEQMVKLRDDMRWSSGVAAYVALGIPAFVTFNEEEKWYYTDYDVD